MMRRAAVVPLVPTRIAKNMKRYKDGSRTYHCQECDTQMGKTVFDCPNINCKLYRPITTKNNTSASSSTTAPTSVKPNKHRNNAHQRHRQSHSVADTGSYSSMAAARKRPSELAQERDSPKKQRMGESSYMNGYSPSRHHSTAAAAAAAASSSSYHASASARTSTAAASHVRPTAPPPPPPTITASPVQIRLNVNALSVSKEQFNATCELIENIANDPVVLNCTHCQLPYVIEPHPTRVLRPQPIRLPYVLQCGHTFCGECLDRIEIHDSYLPCPTCDAHHTFHPAPTSTSMLPNIFSSLSIFTVTPSRPTLPINTSLVEAIRTYEGFVKKCGQFEAANVRLRSAFTSCISYIENPADFGNPTYEHECEVDLREEKNQPSFATLRRVFDDDHQARNELEDEDVEEKRNGQQENGSSSSSSSNRLHRDSTSTLDQMETDDDDQSTDDEEDESKVVDDPLFLKRRVSFHEGPLANETTDEEEADEGDHGHRRQHQINPRPSSSSLTRPLRDASQLKFDIASSHLYQSITSSERSRLVDWLGSKFNLAHATLLYRASRNGWQPKDFFKLVSKYTGPTLTLIKVAGSNHLFGAFTVPCWRQPAESPEVVPGFLGGRARRFVDPLWRASRNIIDETKRSFLFSLHNQFNYPFRMTLKEWENKSSAIVQHPASGPSFGGYLVGEHGDEEDEPDQLPNLTLCWNHQPGNTISNYVVDPLEYNCSYQPVTDSDHPPPKDFYCDGNTLAGNCEFAMEEFEVYAFPPHKGQK